MVQGRGGNQRVKNYTEDGQREGRSTQGREWEGGSSSFAITKNPTRKGGVWGTREEENSGYGYVFA
jgi:hypothetical protein